MKLAIIHPWLLGTNTFDFNAEKSGIAGAEETLINFSKELVRQGVETTVFTKTGCNERINQGVLWKDIETLSPTEWFDYTWSWSDNFELISNFFGVWPQSRFRIFRLVNQQSQESIGKLFSFFHIAVSQSEWLKSKFPILSSNNCIDVSNGIDPQEFNHVKSSITKHKLFYGSDYDRGLSILLDHWPRLLNINPEMELNICYGWEVINSKIERMLRNGNIKEAESFKNFKNIMEQKMCQKGVVHHGRIGHKQVNELIRQCTIWSYPCIFPENCSTLSIKAIAGGLFPCVIRSGGLVETVKSGVYPRYSLWQQGSIGPNEIVNEAIEDWKKNIEKTVKVEPSLLAQITLDSASSYRIKYSYSRVVGKLVSQMMERLS